jgi:thioredoxin 1
MSNTIHATEANFEEEVLRSPVPVLVDFWAQWCGPCKMLAPLLEEIANETQGRFRIAKVDTEESTELAARYNISAIPALLFFAHGKLQHQQAGVTGKKVLLGQLEKLEALTPSA